MASKITRVGVPTIGIIGAGFVGGALARGFAQYTDVRVFDVDEKRRTHSKQEALAQDVVFVALPTPMTKNGSCSTEIISNVMRDLNSLLTKKKLIVLRSTIPPLWIRDHFKLWPNLELVHMPEFLTERTATLDFIQSSRFIFGTKTGKTVPLTLAALFEARFPGVRQVAMTWEGSSLVKYGTNVFFTVKLSYFNELAKVAEALDEEPMTIISEILNDGRIGRSHFQVPGHDGDRGWGGHCFPKDNRAFQHFARVLQVNPVMAKAAWDRNEKVRKDRDWEQMKGRAVCRTSAKTNEKSTKKTSGT